MEGKRFNKGKTRHDLVPAFAQEQYAKVLTKGAEKYDERNWEKGMDWSKVLASMKRHILAFEQGEDFDGETGLFHMAHVMCNAAFLTEYYKIYPQGDDRPKNPLKSKKLGLDIDEVLADFVGGFYDWFDESLAECGRPTFWNSAFIRENFSKVANDDLFWLSLPKVTLPSQLPVEPVCYITSRPIPSEISRKWLIKNGFPDVEVYTVGVDGSKVEIAKKAGVEIFVDDRYENFVELNNAGILCFLMDRPHNRRYDVGFKRIKEIRDIYR